MASKSIGAGPLYSLWYRVCVVFGREVYWKWIVMVLHGGTVPGGTACEGTAGGGTVGNSAAQSGGLGGTVR